MSKQRQQTRLSRKTVKKLTELLAQHSAGDSGLITLCVQLKEALGSVENRTFTDAYVIIQVD